MVDGGQWMVKTEAVLSSLSTIHHLTTDGREERVNRQAFLDQVRHSRLLSDEQLAALAERFTDGQTLQALIAGLIQDGVLTEYQARRLVAGKSAGLVLGQYRILDELGRGGFGQVYKARHTVMDRVVAIKVIAPEFVADERARTWFKREVLAVTQLCHPNIVMAYDAN
jgi:serine/threonine-protein kinase